MQPEFCRLEAFQAFLAQLPQVETTEGLLYAAIAISSHELASVVPQQMDERLQRLADRITRRVKSGQTTAVLAHLHEVLFEEEGYVGEVKNYYAPANSYLPVVLVTKTGLPILLALVYKVVASRCGLEVEGVNAPGHFLVRVKSHEGWMLVDPFNRGEYLSQAEALARTERNLGRPIGPDENVLPTATHRQWLGRMLANLQNVFAHNGQRDELAAMTELQLALANFPR